MSKMLSENNITGLRKLLSWTDFQQELWWFPAYGKPRTIKQIIAYHEACVAEDVETIEELSPIARSKVSAIKT